MFHANTHRNEADFSVINSRQWQAGVVTLVFLTPWSQHVNQGTVNSTQLVITLLLECMAEQRRVQIRFAQPTLVLFNNFFDFLFPPNVRRMETANKQTKTRQLNNTTKYKSVLI